MPTADRLQPMPPVPFGERDRSSSGLPTPLTSFVGRQHDISAILALLRDGARLVTLTGPGGVGKTRLALEVASAIEATDDAEIDDVAFVDLVPIADPALVLPAIAQALGVRDSSHHDPIQRLAAVMRDRAELLILDNFEHVIDAAPLVTELLTACPRLTVIVTSRARLRLSAEQIYPVAPLHIPGSETRTSGRAAETDAVRLFVARARQVNPGFALSPEHLAAVAEICVRLDGLPLAIELAAARSDLLPPSALLKRLDQRLSLLTAGARDQPERLQTMARAIAWSYDLLTEPERVLFRRLSVFAGGCTLEAAEYVCRETAPGGYPGNRQNDAASAFRLPSSVSVFDGISSLADKSLLRLTTVADGEPRITMLETVREFALERLAAEGEEAAVRDRHAAWCLELTARAHREFVVADQRQWVERMEREHANVRVALGWLLDHGGAESALRMAGDLFVFWFLRGHLREGSGWLMQSLTSAAEAPPADRAWAFFGAGFLVWAQGDFARAELLAREGLAIARQHALVFNVATCLFLLHDAVIMQDRLEESIAIGEKALVRMRESGNRSWLAHVLCDVGTAISTAGDRARGSQLVEEGLALHRELGNKQGAGNTLSDLGFDALDDADTPLAVRHFDESLQLLWECGDRWYLASPITGIAVLAADAGHARPAARLIGASSAIRDRSGAPLWPTEKAHFERAVAATTAALGADGYGIEVASGRSLGLSDVVSEARAVAASLLQTDQPDRTETFTLGLSPRELEVLRLLAAGRSNLDIADELFVSRGTVRTHVSSILAKLDAKSRTEAAAIAHREGLL